MDLSLPVLVTVDRRERYELFLPGVTTKTFAGTSLARLMDDVALHFMEQLPNESPDRMSRYEYCPHVELRKPEIEIELPTGEKRETVKWKGRVSAVISRFKEDKFLTVCVPRVSTDLFAVQNLNYLKDGLTRYLLNWAKEHDLSSLNSVACRYSESLEILNFDADLPTILPSQPHVVESKKRRAKKAKAKNKSENKPQKKKKRAPIPPVTLRSVGLNLTHRAMDGRLGRAHLRDRLVNDMMSQLDREGAALLLVGPPGVGKTAIVHEVVHRNLSKGHTLKERNDIWQVDGNRIISGMSMVGAWEQRVQQMVHELRLRQDVLYVNDLPALVYAGRSAHSDSNVAEFLEPHLSQGELRLIGECTHERLMATRDEAPGFFARFRIIHVEPFQERDTLLTLVHAVRNLAEHEDLTIDPASLETILALTRRFETSSVFPGKAVSLLQRAVSDRSASAQDDLGRRKVTRDHLIEYYGRHAGLPAFVLKPDESHKVEDVERYFTRRIVAQPQAAEAAADVVTLLEQGLNDPGRPLSTFLFVGPTGVGKTETAKALAEFLFGAKERMIRLDMSEFGSQGSVARLFGDRFTPDGELTRRVEQQPFSIVLMDEIEKAHPSVFDALLQVLGEGRLTNAAGKTISFTNTVIIMTSNLGVKDARSALGFDAQKSEAVEARYRGAAERYFRPEFFNRIDRVVAFSSLGRDAMLPLVERLLERLLMRRGLRRNSVVVSVDPELVELLIEQGFDPKYGARSVKRMLEKRLAVPLAQHLVTHHSSELTIAQLYGRSGDIRMDLKWPDYDFRAPYQDAGVPTSIRAVEARYRKLQQLLERFEQGEAVEGIAKEYSGLVQAFNEGKLDAKGQDRLIGLGPVLETHRKLMEESEQFYEQYLQSHEIVETLTTSYSSDWYETRAHQLSDFRALQVDRSPLLPDAQRILIDLEKRMAMLLYRARTAQARDPRPVLLRFWPETPEPSVREFAKAVAQGFARCFGGPQFGTARLFELQEDGWSGCDSFGRDPTPSAFAVALGGTGLMGLVSEELGYYLNVIEYGPDLVTGLVRVEEVGDQQDPIARLTQLDQIYSEYLSERREREVESPLPDIQVRRWFRNGVGHDAETSVNLSLGSLSKDLFDMAMIRIFQELQRRLRG